MGLQEYKRKRRFAETPEPAEGGKAGRQRIFVVQLHHASHRHYDFRLELDGVLKSWAVPKGPSFDPAVKRLAMEVEDHPLSYASFEGDIPKGNYGAGHVDVFDHGTWEPLGDAHVGLGKGDLKFTLHGDVLRGEWVLVRTRREGAKNAWLLIKHKDAYAGPREANDFVDPRTDRPIALAKRRKAWPDRPPAAKRATTTAVAPAPDVATDATGRMSAKPKGATPETLRDEPFAPELCRSLPAPPDGDDWLHEVKWDGYRIVATVVRGKVRLWSRNAIEWTHKAPDLARAVASLGLKSAQLDGEMIVLRDGRDDFNALQERLSSAASSAPLVYMLFDVPHFEGQSLRKVPLVARKALLAQLLEARPHPLLRFSAHQRGHGAAAFAQATKAGLEGIVSKRADSHYAGARNGDWVKAKGRPSDEFIVIGFTEPKRSRTGVGALLLARPRDGGLVYVGRVGTGISDQQLRELRARLAKDVIVEPAADIGLMARPDQKLGIWVKPALVVEAWFQGIGGQGLLRQPAFKALRLDKTPEDVIMQAATTGRTKRAASGTTSTAKTASTTVAKASTKRAATSPTLATKPADAVAAKAPVKKAATKTVATKTVATKTVATKTVATKTVATKKAATRKPATRKPATKKAATKKAATKKAATKKAATATPTSGPAVAQLAVKTASAKTASAKTAVAPRAGSPGRSAKAVAVAANTTRAGKAVAPPANDDVVITHPEREVFPGTGITKGEVADYYRAVAPWLLPELAGRPVSVVRCPGGIGAQCFFQKHVATGWGDHVHGVAIRESKGKAQYLCIQDVRGVLQLVQMNVLELHPWGAKSSDPEHADRIVFDLDPHATVKWPRMVAAARDVRAQLASIGLDSFLRTSGGKGLHVVVPLDPPAPWEQVKAFAQAVAQAMAGLRPQEFVSVAGEKNREGRIFIDWLRNGRGATSVASYSLRARATAGVAMPLAWEDLGRVRSGDAFTIRNALARIRKRGADPWEGIARVRQSLPPAR